MKPVSAPCAFHAAEYKGNRDSLEYLLRPGSEATREPHTLVSIIGGFGFLYKVCATTVRLVLIDRNEGQISAARSIIERILNEPTIEGFRAWLESELASPEVCFSGETMETATGSHRFFWYFDRAGLAFQAQASYLRLREALKAAEITYQCLPMEQYNFGDHRGHAVSALVSNADHPMYTSCDAILARLLETMKAGARYSYDSWGRSLTFKPDANHDDAVLKISKYTENWNVTEIPTFLGCHFSKDELRAASHTLAKGRPLIPKDYFGKHCLLSHIQVSPDSGNEAKRSAFNAWLASSVVGYQRMIIFDFLTTPAVVWLDWILNSPMAKSYRVSSIEFTGGRDTYSRSVIIVLDLIV